jgi:hypothetical protein
MAEGYSAADVLLVGQHEHRSEMQALQRRSQAWPCLQLRPNKAIQSEASSLLEWRATTCRIRTRILSEMVLRSTETPAQVRHRPHSPFALGDCAASVTVRDCLPV